GDRARLLESVDPVAVGRLAGGAGRCRGGRQRAALQCARPHVGACTGAAGMTALAQSQAPKLRPWKLVLGGIVVAMLAVLAWGLTRDPSYIPSQLVGRSMPAFALPALDGKGTVAADELRGTPLVINFWASWCVS